MNPSRLDVVTPIPGVTPTLTPTEAAPVYPQHWLAPGSPLPIPEPMPLIKRSGEVDQEAVDKQAKTLAGNWSAQREINTAINQSISEFRQQVLTKDGLNAELLNHPAVLQLTQDMERLHLASKRITQTQTEIRDIMPGVTTSPQQVWALERRAWEKNPNHSTPAALNVDEVCEILDLPMDQKGRDAYAVYTKAFKRYMRSTGVDNLEMKTRGNMGPQYKRALFETGDSSGGFLVIPEFMAFIRKRAFEYSPIREIARTFRCAGTEIKIPGNFDLLPAQWEPEGIVSDNTGNQTYEMLTIPVNTLYASPAVSVQLIEDAYFDIQEEVGRQLGTAFGRAEGTAYVKGNGEGQPRGFLTFPFTSLDSNNEVKPKEIEQVYTGSTTGITYNGLQQLMMGSLKEVYRPNATLLMNRLSLPQLLEIQDGAGRYVFSWFQSFMEGGFDMRILGHPVRLAYDMPLCVNGALAFAFGDFEEGYAIADRLGMTMLVNPYKAGANIILYQTRMRVGGNVSNRDAIKLGICHT